VRDSALSRAKLEALGGGRFRVSGVLDATTVGELLKQSKDRFAANLDRLEVDLAGVSDGDSAGLALLIEWMRLARDAKREIRFANMPGQIGALARISEVDDLLSASTTGSTSPPATA
jgi:phospholipid transport system transporter-binding protein